MPSWEEEKRNAQMAFTAPESDREAAHASVDSFYSHEAVDERKHFIEIGTEYGCHEKTRLWSL